jgi:hypothetical protein
MTGKMIHIRNFLFGLCGMVLILQSCDKVSAPYMTPKANNDTGTNINIRKILLEDYTGHLCPNCPTATNTGEVLAAASNGAVIMMAVHAGHFADSATSGIWTANYKTAAGEEWNSYYNIQANPIGLLDRKTFGSTNLITYDLWAQYIDTLLTYPQEAWIKITNTYNSSTRSLGIKLDMKFLKDLEGSFNITACIVEDSLIGPQKNSNPNFDTVPVIYHYVFMDVLRGSVNGSWGEQFITEPDTAVVYTKNYSYTLHSDWVPKHCSVIAFISNSSSKEIVQAEKAKVVK